MPGRYEHVISLDYDLSDFRLDVSFPSEFADLIDEINEDLEVMQARLEYACENVIIPSAGELSQDAQRGSLDSYGSVVKGTLRDSIDITPMGNAVSVGTDLFYAEYVNDGRPPVHAKNKDYLHFVTKDGNEVFTKSVKAAAPRPYLESSNDQLDHELEGLLNSTIEGII